MMTPWREVSRREPCPLCGKCSWCSRSADGVWVACRRLDTGEGIHRVDKAGIDYWLYHLTGVRRADRPVINPPVPLASERANPDTLKPGLPRLASPAAVGATPLPELAPPRVVRS
jgi:hypothetical protein